MVFELCVTYDLQRTDRRVHDLSTLYTTYPHNLTKEKNKDLTECSLQGKSSPYLACNERKALFTSER